MRNNPGSGGPGAASGGQAPAADVRANRRPIWRWVKIALLLYCGAGIALYYGQDKLLFHPVPLPRATVYDFKGQPYREVNLPYDKETRLNIIEFGVDRGGGEASDSGVARVVGGTSDSGRMTRGVVLYFHGNGENISRYAGDARNFTRRGYEVWMLDYPGFGKSTGLFSELRLYDYALQLYKLARSRWAPSQIILYGQHLGAGISAQLADIRDCRRLILESPAYSLPSLASYYLPIYPWERLLHYRFPIYEHLPAVTAPITIFQGTKDHRVPYGNALRLKPLLKAGDEFITIEGGGHTDLPDFPLYRQKLDSVLGL